MEARFYDDTARFWDVARELLEADPVRHTTILSVVFALLNQPRPGAEQPTLLTLHDDMGVVRGASLWTPPWPLALSAVEVDDVPFVIEVLQARNTAPGSVMGPRPVAEAFAKQWVGGDVAAVRAVMDLRLYRLAELDVPDVAGRARVATEADLPLLTRYWRDFSREAPPERMGTDERARAEVSRSLALGYGNLLWEVDGVPVSSATAKLPTAGTSRIGPVYTPPEFRRRGYAAAVTAAAAQWAQNAGATGVLLYTDLANPTSNSVYQRIGFRPVDDYVELAI